jgi:hypothetical protein
VLCKHALNTDDEPKGKITRYFYGMAYLPFDIKLGLIEASEGKIGPTIRKMSSVRVNL